MFEYRDNQLMAENLPLAEIADRVGTPVYVYSKAAFTTPLDDLESAFKDIPHLVAFSVKCASNLSLLGLVAERGLGADIVSGGELYRALRAGIDPGRVVYSGVGKTAREMAEALTAGILIFNAESEEELHLLAETAASLKRRARISLRVNPAVDPGTHPYVATGLKESKFGMAPEAVLKLYRWAAQNPNLEVVGADCHIGSQLLTASPFLAAAEKLRDLIFQLKKDGIELKYIDLGGGLGVTYQNETPPSLAEYAAGLKGILSGLPGLTLILEPGRFVAANSAVLLVKTLYHKTNGDKRFVIVDGAMNDLIRPSLYGSRHEIAPVRPSGRPEVVVDVVGPICESGDFLGKDRRLPALAAGDLLAVKSAGAYGFTMSSNYNSRPRAAEVLVSGGDFRVIRPRETYEDLVRGE